MKPELMNMKFYDLLEANEKALARIKQENLRLAAKIQTFYEKISVIKSL